MKIFEKKRTTASKAWQAVQTAPPLNLPNTSITHVSSINNPEVQTLLDNTPHDLIIVKGTSLIRKHILKSAHCIVNLHAGITPEYRGSHGATWAVINDEPHNAGVTLHFVDEGIDTGAILSQQHTPPTRNDTLISLAR